MSLAELGDIAADAKRAFESACVAAGFSDMWDAYRSDMRGSGWPFALIEADKAYRDALHAFYLARDGAAGVLGSRGL